MVLTIPVVFSGDNNCHGRTLSIVFRKLIIAVLRVSFEVTHLNNSFVNFFSS
jgi:hypothetical protein